MVLLIEEEDDDFVIEFEFDELGVKWLFSWF